MLFALFLSNRQKARRAFAAYDHGRDREKAARIEQLLLYRDALFLYHRAENSGRELRLCF